MATVPVTRTWVAGEVVLASHFNTNIRDVLNYLLAPPLLEVEPTGSQSLTTSTWTALAMASEIVDTSGMHSNVTNNSRATAVYPGYYIWGGALGMQGNGTGARYLSAYKNGAQVNASASNMDNTGVFLNAIVPGRRKVIFLNVGDYVETYGWQNSGGNLSTVALGADLCSMSMKWESN